MKEKNTTYHLKEQTRFILKKCVHIPREGIPI